MGHLKFRVPGFVHIPSAARLEVYVTLFEGMQPCWDLIGDKLALENEGEGMTVRQRCTC